MASAKPKPPGKKRNGLTPREKLFVQEYLVDLNGTEAARRCGYSERSAARLAYDLLHKPPVKAAIQAAVDARAKKVGITAERVLEELGRIAFADIGQVFNAAGGLRPLSEIPEDARRALASVESDELFEGRGEERSHVGYTRKVRLLDKVRALELAGKNVGLFKEAKVEADDLAAAIVAARKRAGLTSGRAR